MPKATIGEIRTMTTGTVTASASTRTAALCGIVSNGDDKMTTGNRISMDMIHSELIASFPAAAINAGNRNGTMNAMTIVRRSCAAGQNVSAMAETPGRAAMMTRISGAAVNTARPPRNCSTDRKADGNGTGRALTAYSNGAKP